MHATRLADFILASRQPTEPALACFHAARRAANHARADWLRAGPADADIALEIDASMAVLLQLVALARAGMP